MMTLRAFGNNEENALFFEASGSLFPNALRKMAGSRSRGIAWFWLFTHAIGLLYAGPGE
jgi:hypothetical protein